MNFREVLERICSRVDGSLGAVIIAEDGIVVERHAVAPDLDLDLASVELAGAGREVRRATEGVQAGELEEVLVSNAGRVAVLRRIGPGYYLILFMLPSGILGRGRHELRRAAHELAGEFA